MVCEAFNCTPDVALKQDWGLVCHILEYRMAQSAKAQFNSDASKMTDAQTESWNAITQAMRVVAQGDHDD